MDQKYVKNKKSVCLTPQEKRLLKKAGVGFLDKEWLEYIFETHDAGGLTHSVGGGRTVNSCLLLRVQVKKNRYDKNKDVNIINSLLAPEYRFLHGNVSDTFAFEIWLDRCRIDFYFWIPEYRVNTFLDLIRSQYPDAQVTILKKPCDDKHFFIPLKKGDIFRVDRLVLSHFAPMPIITNKKDDLLASLLTAISDTNPDMRVVFQVMFQPASATGFFKRWWSPWKRFVKKMCQQSTSFSAGYSFSNPCVKRCIQVNEKVNRNAFYVEIRYTLLLPAHSQNKTVTENVYELNKKTMSITSALKQTTSDLGQGFVPWMFGNFTVGHPDRKRFIKTLLVVRDRVIHNKYLRLKPRLWTFLTSDELQEVVHLPSDECNSSGVNWLYGVTERVPEVFMGSPPSPDDIVIGHTVDVLTGKDVKVYIPFNDLGAHVCLLGRTCVGKSTVALNMILQLIRNPARYPVIVFDPHAQLLDDIVRRCPVDRLDDIVYFTPSTTMVSDKGESYTCGFNPLYIEGMEELRRQGVLGDVVQLRVAQIISSLKDYMVSLTGSDVVWGSQLDHVFNATLSALFDYHTVTGNPITFLDIQRIITDPKICLSFAEYASDEGVKRYMVNRIAKRNRREDMYFESSLNRVSAVLLRESVRRSICAREPMSITRLLEQGKILLISLNLGDSALVSLVGSMLMSHIYFWFIEKSLMNERQHKALTTGVKPTFVFCDEAPTYASLTSSRIMSEGAKRGLRLVTIMQYSKQMLQRVKDAVFENAGTIITGGVGHDTAKELSTIFADDGNGYNIYETRNRMEKDLFDLSEYKIAVKMLYNNMRLPSIVCSTYPAPPMIFNDNDDDVDGRVRRIKEQSVKQYGYKIKKEEEKLSGVELESKRIITVLKTVYDLNKKYDKAVLYDDIRDNIPDKDTADPTVLPHILEMALRFGFIYKENIKEKNKENIIEEKKIYAITISGKDKIGARDVVTHAPSETSEHIAQLNRFKEWCYKQNVKVEIVLQGGGVQKSDGVIPKTETGTGVWNVESECTTVTQPIKILRNLQKGLKKGVVGVIFLVSEKRVEKLWDILQPRNWTKYHDEQGRPVNVKTLKKLFNPRIPIYHIVIVPKPGESSKPMLLYNSPKHICELGDVYEIIG